MRWSATIIALFAVSITAAQAQVRKFPYEATITQDETYVRSGPGTRYYPTSRLTQGVRVQVHRHDPGGWYMISPPAGSFSWIRAEYVQSADGKRGTLTENQIVVRVGSDFGDNKEVEQKRLSRGDTVQILGEKTFPSEQGSIRMFKIAPPRGEYRWVPGQFVAPADAIARQQHDSNPFNPPAIVKETPKPQPKVSRKDPFADEKPELSSRQIDGKPIVRVSPSDGVAITNRPQAGEDEVRKLKELDAQFRAIVRRDTSEWDFVALEEGYRDLQQNASTDAFRDQLSQRFAALAKYQKIKDQYDDFVRLTRETSERDAQLINESGPRPTVVSRPPSQPEPELQPVPETNLPTQSDNPPAELKLDTRPSQPVPRPKLDGAGIIQPSAVSSPGFPAHVLLAPNGRILAYLESKGSVNLDEHVGKAMGIIGARSYRTDLEADSIQVESVIPVRLK